MKPRQYAVLLLLGFASGLPLFLTGSTLKAWMTDEGLSLATIGLFSFVTLPYSLKVFWAPFLDRYALPGFGRRRGWMLAMQGAMAVALALLALSEPHLDLLRVVILALAVAVTSATFDIAVDAWRAEALDQKHLGLGNSIHIAAYRVAMLVSGGLAMILAQVFGWRVTYLGMAGLTLLGMVGTWLAMNTDAVAQAPRSLQEAVSGPLRDLLQRKGIGYLLAFAVFYKLGDWLAEAMTMPFLMRGMGFTKMQIGTVQKTTAMVAIILGGLIGGWMLMRMSLRKALWICGFVQAGSILGFWAISMLGRHLPLLVAANTLENLAYGMGGSALVALLMGSCNRSYTGTQYALFSALTALPRTVFGGLTGFMAESYGWKLYFPVCAAAAIPGLLLLLLWDRWGLPETDEA
ncbi:AmpG family muropeptide MFS transporter [Geothrix sp.]|jgi:PAT family beta-lactamase induction signal transducer AmpG|uniref:AmpG family muropeptide MFS transporter n=1 Tax=Geothrix sp. TaxID=1962974 RepID=UPI0025C434EF|nr:AmpG family muropeptide MFS transporter [Geothrix sp.]